MVFGKLYTMRDNPRSIPIIAIAKANNIELEIVETKPGSECPEYRKINKLGKVPTFVGANGFVLRETIAISMYITSQNPKTELLGKTKEEYVSILQWMSFTNGEIASSFSGWLLPIYGRTQYNKKVVDESLKATNRVLETLEEHLLHNTYLIGDILSLADIFCIGIMSRGFQYQFGKEWRAAHPTITRWYETVYNQPIYLDVAEELKFIDEPIKYQTPKKEAPPKAVAKPKKEVEAEEEEETHEAPKAKHPLEALPKPSFVLDEWKRQYSNNETPDALKWFWENYKSEEYSLWKIQYKYNEELSHVFMSSNLIGGFFARLEASRKYIFGCASVFGVKDDSVIQGAFVIRGQDAAPALDVAPDFDSYEVTKLDPTNEEDKKFVEEQWSWEKPITVNGKEFVWADGKVFK